MHLAITNLTDLKAHKKVSFQVRIMYMSDVFLIVFM